MYCKYCNSLFNIRYSYLGKNYCDVPVHWRIVAGLITTFWYIDIGLWYCTLKTKDQKDNNNKKEKKNNEKRKKKREKRKKDTWNTLFATIIPSVQTGELHRLPSQAPWIILQAFLSCSYRAHSTTKIRHQSACIQYFASRTSHRKRKIWHPTE